MNFFNPLTSDYCLTCHLHDLATPITLFQYFLRFNILFVSSLQLFSVIKKIGLGLWYTSGIAGFLSHFEKPKMHHVMLLCQFKISLHDYNRSTTSTKCFVYLKRLRIMCVLRANNAVNYNGFITSNWLNDERGDTFLAHRHRHTQYYTNDENVYTLLFVANTLRLNEYVQDKPQPKKGFCFGKNEAKCLKRLLRKRPAWFFFLQLGVSTFVQEYTEQKWHVTQVFFAVTVAVTFLGVTAFVLLIISMSHSIFDIIVNVYCQQWIFSSVMV